MRSKLDVGRGKAVRYRSLRTGDGDKDRGTLNLMASVGSWCLFRIQDATVVTVLESSTTCFGLPTTVGVEAEQL